MRRRRSCVGRQRFVPRSRIAAWAQWCAQALVNHGLSPSPPARVELSAQSPTHRQVDVFVFLSTRGIYDWRSGASWGEACMHTPSAHRGAQSTRHMHGAATGVSTALQPTTQPHCDCTRRSWGRCARTFGMRESAPRRRGGGGPSTTPARSCSPARRVVLRAVLLLTAALRRRFWTWPPHQSRPRCSDRRRSRGQRCILRVA